MARHISAVSLKMCSINYSISEEGACIFKLVQNLRNVKIWDFMEIFFCSQIFGSVEIMSMIKSYCLYYYLLRRLCNF